MIVGIWLLGWGAFFPQGGRVGRDDGNLGERGEKSHAMGGGRTVKKERRWKFLKFSQHRNSKD